MTRSPRARLLVCVVLLVVLAPAIGCSDDDDAAPSTTATGPTISTATTTTSSTSSTTTEPSAPSTSAPATTVDEVAATKAAVASAVSASRDAYNYAIFNYDAPDALDVLAQSVVRDSPSWAGAVQNIDLLRSNGWRARPHPDIPDTSTVEGDITLVDGPPPARAEATICTISAGVVYQPGGAPDGSDLIVNDEVVARRERVTLVLEDGAWKLLEGTNIGIWRGDPTCPAT